MRSLKSYLSPPEKEDLKMPLTWYDKFLIKLAGKEDAHWPLIIVGGFIWLFSMPYMFIRVIQWTRMNK